MIEKPFWMFGRYAVRLWRFAIAIWHWVMRLLGRDAVRLATVFLYAIGGAIFLSLWPASRDWLNIHRAVDTVLPMLFLVWFLMLVVWAHQRLQENLLRWIPAVLLAPLWLPWLLVLFGLLVVLAVIMLCLSILLTPAGCLATILGLLFSWWRWRHGITVRCTKGECLSERRYLRDLQIEYVCPDGCGARYGFLIPSHLGIFYHNCTCGGRLPALAFLRNLKTAEGVPVETTLHKVCPRGHPWGIGSDALPSHFVAVVGGTSAGKTCYMTMVVQALLDGKSVRLRGEFESTSDRRAHDDRVGSLSGGHRLRPTQRGVPEAVVLRLHENKRRDVRLYFYDAAGEEYNPVERAIGEEFVFFEDLTGVILLVDPLALPNLRKKLKADAEAASAWNALGVSETPLENVVASLRRNVRDFLRFGRSGRDDIPIAVVLNKADVPAVTARVGTEAIRQAAGTHGTGAGALWEKEHELCRRALVDWGAASEVAALEQDFPRIRYCSCSSLGRTPDQSGRPFTPERVLPPILWLLKPESSNGGSR